MGLVIILLYGFAWAIGGEKYFGKWRRGILVFVPILIHGLINNFVWYYYLIQALACYLIYQALFYDRCIKLIWPDSGTPLPWMVWVGRVGLILNGMLCGINIFILQYKYMGILSAFLLTIWSGFMFLACCCWH